jgi:hypothetical protein
MVEKEEWMLSWCSASMLLIPDLELLRGRELTTGECTDTNPKSSAAVDPVPV